MAQVDVITEAIIFRPMEAVAGFAFDPDKAPEWYMNIKSVKWKTPRPLELGSRIAFGARFLGKQLAYVYEIKELLPGEKLVMATTEGPFPMETTYSLDTTAEGATRMSLRNRGFPSGFSKWFAPFMALAMKRANRKDLQKLKEILEAHAR